MKISNPIAKLGEDLAVKHLKDKGYKIIERNFRKGYGEIDIIAQKDNILVFIEVKARTNKSFGTPFESVNYFKIRTLTKTALFYKSLYPKLPEALRMDAISVLVSKDGRLLEIEHLENISI